MNLRASPPGKKVETAKLMPLRIETICINSGNDLPRGSASLFAAGEKEGFDLSGDWYRLLETKALPQGVQAKYLVLLRQGEAQAVMPLFLRRLRVWGRQGGGMTNFYSSLYRPLLSPSIDADNLADGLRALSSGERLSVLRFDAMDPEHPTFFLLESALRKAGFMPHRFFCFGNWYLPVMGRSFEEYFNGLSSRIRNSIMRGRRKFFADGRGRLELITSKGVEQAIKDWNRVYAASWKVPEPFLEFVPGLIQLSAERGWLRLGMAYYDDEPVAGQIWIVAHGRASIYKLAYDEKMSKLSIGSILSAYLMAHVLDVDKVQEVDYLIGDDAYKKDWMTHRRERWGLVAYNPWTLAGLTGLVIQLLGKLRRSLKQDEAPMTVQDKGSASVKQMSNASSD